MEHTMLHMPASYALVEAEELTYLDGGELSELQTKLLIGGITAVITSVMLVPNVFAYMFSPILTPINNAIEGFTTKIVDSIKNIFS